LISTRHDGGRISLAEQERGFGGRRRAATETEEKRGAVGEEGGGIMESEGTLELRVDFIQISGTGPGKLK
jgi:hypothetical protein